MIIGYQLGRIKELSELEIKSVVARDVAPSLALSIVTQAPLTFHTDKWSTSWGQLPSERIASTCSEALSNQILTLGGTIRIYELLANGREIEKFLIESNTLKNIAKKIYSKLARTPNKMNIGLSVLNGNIKFAQLRTIMQTIKKEAKSEGQSIRIVMPKDRHCELNAASVVSNKLLTKGYEIVFIPTGKNNYYYIGLTIAIHNPDRDAWLDFEIPRPDARSGMLPPKLARMMVNIAVDGEKDVTVFDPFCGNGRVLLEALLLRYQTFGRDIDREKVDSTKQNIGWLRDNVSTKSWFLGGPLPDAQVFQGDARERAKINVPKPNVMVTEPWLGPPLRDYPEPNVGRKIASQVEDLLIASIPNLVAVQSKRIVMIVPRWKLAGKEELSIAQIILDEFIKTGYDGSCIANVGRDDSFLTREILLMNRNN